MYTYISNKSHTCLDHHNVSSGSTRETYVYVTLIEIRAVFTTNGIFAHKPALSASSFNHDGPAKGDNDRDCGGSAIVGNLWRHASHW